MSDQAACHSLHSPPKLRKKEQKKVIEIIEMDIIPSDIASFLDTDAAASMPSLLQDYDPTSRLFKGIPSCRSQSAAAKNPQPQT
mmetsp:Transcript_12816/g.32678  ORF Transcript_12816/g.32678 Transcript_12816/m.32678 type:complete len:84 (-) Transcript_12816:1157-1408(-)